MSNQRAGTWKSANMSAGDSYDRKLLEFFRAAKVALEKSDKEDAAFYFEQVEDWLLSGHKLSDNVYKVLGL